MFEEGKEEGWWCGRFEPLKSTKLPYRPVNKISRSEFPAWRSAGEQAPVTMGAELRNEPDQDTFH